MAIDMFKHQCFPRLRNFFDLSLMEHCVPAASIGGPTLQFWANEIEALDPKLDNIFNNYAINSLL